MSNLLHRIRKQKLLVKWLYEKIMKSTSDGVYTSTMYPKLLTEYEKLSDLIDQYQLERARGATPNGSEAPSEAQDDGRGKPTKARGD